MISGSVKAGIILRQTPTMIHAFARGMKRHEIFPFVFLLLIFLNYLVISFDFTSYIYVSFDIIKYTSIKFSDVTFLYDNEEDFRYFLYISDFLSNFLAFYLLAVSNKFRSRFIAKRIE